MERQKSPFSWYTVSVITIAVPFCKWLTPNNTEQETIWKHRSLLHMDEDTCIHSKINCFDINAEDYSNKTIHFEWKYLQTVVIYICDLRGVLFLILQQRCLITSSPAKADLTTVFGKRYPDFNLDWHGSYLRIQSFLFPQRKEKCSISAGGTFSSWEQHSERWILGTFYKLSPALAILWKAVFSRARCERSWARRAVLALERSIWGWRLSLQWRKGCFHVLLGSCPLCWHYMLTCFQPPTSLCHLLPWHEGSL